MDEPARRYLLLALRLNRLRPGCLEAYAGPAELAEAVDGEPPPLAVELHDEALALADAAGSLAEPRASWFAAQVRAMGTAARLLDGEEIAYPESVEEVLDVPAEPEPEQAFATAHRLLDAVLAPGGTLAERLAAHRRSRRLPEPAVLPSLERAVRLLQRRTHEDLGLPDGERLELGAGSADGEDARLIIRGTLTSSLEVDPRRCWTPAALYSLAAGLGYPGGHAEWAAKAARGGELLARCPFTPARTVSAAVGILGREALLGDWELGAEVASLGRRAGLLPDAERESAVRRAEELLRAAPANAALAVLRDGLPIPEAGDYLREVGLLEDGQVRRELARLRSPLDSVLAFAAPGGVRIGREWLEQVGQTHGMRRLLAEPLSPGALRAEVDRRPRPTPFMA